MKVFSSIYKQMPGGGTGGLTHCPQKPVMPIRLKIAENASTMKCL